MTDMTQVETSITGVFVISRNVIRDNRGSFSRVYCADDARRLGIPDSIAQVNHSVTHRKGTARGLHFQIAPHAETKFVRCVRGQVFDVAVDLRHNSPTFLKWHAELLSSENYKSLVIPKGCAHGFQALSDECELLYLHTAKYAPEAERGFHLADPMIRIVWPLPLDKLSDRDSALPKVDRDFLGIRV